MLGSLQGSDTANSNAKQDVQAVCASLLRDHIFEVLGPVEGDVAAARSSLRNDDDAGARYHLKRIVACAKAAASSFNELNSLRGVA